MTRTALLELLGTEVDTPAGVERFRAANAELFGPIDLPDPERFDGAGVHGWRGLLPRERRLVWKVRALESAPFGVTLSGAAYEDNPIVYATRTFREFTGYPMAELHGENPRLLQGTATEAEAIATLHEALRGWHGATVELWNYRRDGTRFRNRVSLRPVFDATGTVTHWYGVQERVDG